MQVTQEIADDFRETAAKLNKAADALDPPTRAKPGPKPGARKKQKRGRKKSTDVRALPGSPSEDGSTDGSSNGLDDPELVASGF